MPMQVPPSPDLPRAIVLDEVNLCIAEAEIASCAQADAIRILTRTGYDTTEAVWGLFVDMDALSALQVVRCALRSGGRGGATD